MGVTLRSQDDKCSVSAVDAHYKVTCAFLIARGQHQMCTQHLHSLLVFSLCWSGRLTSSEGFLFLIVVYLMQYTAALNTL